MAGVIIDKAAVALTGPQFRAVLVGASVLAATTATVRLVRFTPTPLALVPGVASDSPTPPPVRALRNGVRVPNTPIQG